MIARLGKYPNQVLKIAATHLKWWPVLDSWQCIFYGQFWIKKMKYMVFYILFRTLLQIVKKKISDGNISHLWDFH